MKGIELTRGDITVFEADAIVNAARSTLMGGGGVDGAIHRAAGPELLEECQHLNGCATGEAKITKGYNLKARFVIHTVGPVWHDGTRKESSLLKNCYMNSLKIAAAHAVKTIAFPNISTGAFGYPKQEAAEIAISTVREWLSSHPQPQKVFFVVYDEENAEIYKRLLA